VVVVVWLCMVVYGCGWLDGSVVLWFCGSVPVVVMWLCVCVCVCAVCGCVVVWLCDYVVVWSPQSGKAASFSKMVGLAVTILTKVGPMVTSHQINWGPDKKARNI
jgi:hypothetical protein